MDEAKQILRSILVSSPLKINVAKLNYDYKEMVGYNIPYRELGFQDLFSFLRAIPDVLKISGNDMQSEVRLIVSAKVAHVNDMVLCQKNPKKHNSKKRYSWTQKNIGKHQPQHTSTRNAYPTKKTYHNLNQKDQINSEETEQLQQILKINSQIQNKPLCNNIDANDSKGENIDIKLKGASERSDDSKEGSNNDENSNKLQYKFEQFLVNEEECINNKSDDFMRQILLSKMESTIEKNKFQEKIPSIKTDQVPSRVPQKIQDNLIELISKYPEGLLCTQLPGVYKKIVGSELNYGKFGYRWLISMCMDLHNIFACVKESSCDFRLFDVRRPVPEVKILPDDEPVKINTQELQSALPKLDWTSYKSFIPEDAVCLETEIDRQFLPKSVKANDVVEMRVTEIYDPSKFWVHLNDGKLDKLMDDMQTFYNKHKSKYLIPECLLEVGLYCVAFTLTEFHRVVIVSVQPEDDFVKVFFIDYGSLSVVPKKEVWFLSRSFSELCGQAIRARLAGIYPPVENTTWSKEAICTFKYLASMKFVKATIDKIQSDKKIIEVYLEKYNFPPENYIQDILVGERQAQYVNSKRDLAIEDLNCIPKLKFFHLLPLFEEIEHWLVPSADEVLKLSKSEVPAELFFPQYFDRPHYKDLIGNIERKTEKLHKKKERLIKHIDVSQLGQMIEVQDINKLIYGKKYQNLKENLLADEEIYVKTARSTLVESHSNSNDYDNLLNTLRRKHLRQDSSYEENTEMSNVHVNGRVNNSSLLDLFRGDTENSSNRSRDDGRSMRSRKEALLNLGNANRNDNLVNLSDLEKYVSEEESSRNAHHLLNTEEFYPVETNSISTDTNYNQLDSNFFKYRNGENSNREYISILDAPIDSQIPVIDKANSSNSDLIDLDVVLDAPSNVLIPEIVGSKRGSNRHNLSEDEDDENKYNTILNPDAKEFSFKSRVSPKKSFCNESIQTDPIGSLNTSTVVACRPPPGFGPIPKYGCSSNGITEPNMPCKMYESWSTSDYFSTNPVMVQHNMNYSMQQQYLFRQVPQMNQYPPIIVFNYNAAPLPP